MTRRYPIRSLALIAAPLVLAALSPLAQAQGIGVHGGGPRPAPPIMAPRQGNLRNEQHLGAWMESHRNLSVTEQQRALEREPGFHDLPPQTQQRMRDKITQLNNMPPSEREQLISRTEALERLSPAQRLQVRGAMDQYGALPPRRRQLVGRAFHQLQGMPEPQRTAYLNSLRGQFTLSEQAALNSLLAVGPYLPPQ